MGLFDDLTNIDEILKKGFDTLDNKYETLISVTRNGFGIFPDSPDQGDVIVNPVINLSDVLEELRILHEDLNSIQTNVDLMADIYATSNGHVHRHTEILAFEGKDMPISSSVTSEILTPFAGKINNIHVFGKDGMVNMQLYVDGIRVFPFNGSSFFPSYGAKFNTDIDVAAGKKIRCAFENGDSVLEHTVQMYVTMMETPV